MGKQQIIEIALVIIGLLFLVLLIQAIPTVYVLFQISPTQNYPDPEAGAYVALTSVSVYGVMGMLFLIFPQRISRFLVGRLSPDEYQSPRSTEELLIVGMVLLGLYAVITGLSELFGHSYLFRYLFDNRSSLFELLAPVVQLTLGLVLVLRPGSVIKWIPVTRSSKE